jgi:RNA polymerase sigma factor (sigma-70 family)
MAKGQLDAVLQYIRGSFQTLAVAPLTDGQLLDRFIRERSEDAFTVLVQRHAAMVMTVACGVLHDPHQAEDVFQATFLILAKNAGSIRRRRALGGWLHKVAYHLALEAQADNTRRQAQERRVRIMPQLAPEANLDRLELRAVLDQELSHLPEKYRTLLILHYLEGKSKDETAVQLGCSAGTVSGRLARARKLLRSRLVRRGFTLSSGALVAILAQSTAAVAVSPSLLKNTVEAALAFTGGIKAGTAVSVSAARLAEGMAKRIALAKIKMIVGVVLGASVLGVGASALTHRALVSQANDGPHDQAPHQVTTQPETPQRGLRTTTEQLDSQGAASNTEVHLAASGRVLDDQGKPISSATVYLRELALLRDAVEREKQSYTDILAQTKTGADGRFAFKDVAAEPMKTSPSNIYRLPWSIVVTSKGHAVAWHVFKSRNEQDLKLVMRTGTRLHGRLMDNKEKPAAGVRVQISVISYRRHGRFGHGWHSGSRGWD